MAKVLLAGTDQRTRSADLEWKHGSLDSFAGAVRAQFLVLGMDERKLALKHTGQTAGRAWAVFAFTPRADADGPAPGAIFAYEAPATAPEPAAEE